MALREFSDSRGREWRVWDTYPEHRDVVQLADVYTDGWLCFQCEAEKRRLAPVPARWDEEPVDRLRVLLEQAERVETPRHGWADAISDRESVLS